MKWAKTHENLHERINTANIVPLAASNTMLFIGTHMLEDDCDFELRKFFIVAGSVGLSLSVFRILGKLLLEEMTSVEIRRKMKNILLGTIALMNGLLRVGEVVALIAGFVIAFAHIARVTFDETQSNKDGYEYCNEGAYIFASVFFGFSVTILLVGGILWLAWFIHDSTKRG